MRALNLSDVIRNMPDVSQSVQHAHTDGREQLSAVFQPLSLCHTHQSHQQHKRRKQPCEADGQRQLDRKNQTFNSLGGFGEGWNKSLLQLSCGPS